jgi:hypothetical protein
VKTASIFYQAQNNTPNIILRVRHTLSGSVLIKGVAPLQRPLLFLAFTSRQPLRQP